MFIKFYNGLGITTCLLLGIAFATHWQFPSLGLFDSAGSSSGHSSYSSGRSWFSSSSGWSFGK